MSTLRTLARTVSVVALSMATGGVMALQLHKTAAVAAAPEVASPAQTGANAPVVAPLTPDTFRGIAKRETDGVVNISTTKTVKRSLSEDPFRFFFGQRGGSPFGGQPSGPEREQKQTLTSLGSGFVIDKDGTILTNRHVVEGADKVVVSLTDGRKYEAKVLGQDERTDVALLKIEPRQPLTVVELGDSDQTEVGEWVMAIGNPFGLGGNSVTVGVVSYKGRPLDLARRSTPIEMIQTDASINPGNSGGPLLNAKGQAIGINTLIITQGVEQSAGVGFAVPINEAREILSQLKARGHVVRGWLGVQVQALDEDMAQSLKLKDTKGALVADVTSGSPAEKAGLKPGDVVVALDGKPIESSSELSRQVAAKAPGAKMSVEVVRDGAHKSLPVTLGTFPDTNAENDAEPAGEQGRIGLSLRPVTPEIAGQLNLPRDLRGLYVAEVVPGSKAEAAGIQAGDVIVSVNGEEVTTVEGLKAEVAKAPDGLSRLRVHRGNGYTFLVLRMK
jgi:serine protease Do